MNKNTKINTNQPFWTRSVKDTLSSLQTSLAGLKIEEVEERQKEFGLNKLDKGKRFSKLKILLNQFKSPLIFILIIACLVTVFVQEWVDAGVIFLAIAVNAILGFYQENRAENALERLKSYIKERARVIRDGKETEIDAQNLVPGDIIYLSYGSRIPADARLIESKSLSVDEAILTGESLPVSKSLEDLSEGTDLPERKNMVFAGTVVVEGYARAVVVSTGELTEIGKIAKLVTSSDRGKTPLQKAIWKLAWVIAGVITVLVTGLFVLGVSRGEPIFEMFLISSAVAVGAIPEALPIALTVVLSVGVEQLAKRKGIMRNLAAAETLGSTSVILTDKTGTLTKADLTLVDILTVGNLLEESYVSKEIKSISKDQKELLRLAFTNTDTVIENPEDSPNDWRLIGRPLENKIVRSAGVHGIDLMEMKKTTHYHSVLSFNSVNKFSATHVNESNDSYYVILGAPDILLERSNLNKKDYLKIKKSIEEMSNDGKRLLGIGKMKSSNKKDDVEFISPEQVSEIEFLGIFSFFDPVRPEVPAAIKRVEKSGVKVIMATGDLKGTAISIGRELGWEISEGQVLTGEELKTISDEDLLENIDNIKIYARVTPEDKLRIAKLFKSRGEVVGMTGDGVNDAPSLKGVDIGIAVGSGSDVAKEVADLVLLDDNFQTIVAAIEEGRRILSNIRKSFVYLVSSSFDEVILIGGSLIIGLSLPLTALQIIWVNFFTGSLPALSYAFDDFTDRNRMTAKSSRKIINGEVKALTLGIGIITSVLLLVLYWYLSYINIPEIEARTFLFACFASYILFVSFSFRSLKRPIFSYNIFSNKFLSWSVVIGLILIAITIYIPFLQEIFGTVALTYTWLGWLALWIVINIGLVEGIKWIYRNTA